MNSNLVNLTEMKIPSEVRVIHIWLIWEMEKIELGFILEMQ